MRRCRRSSSPTRSTSRFCSCTAKRTTTGTYPIQTDRPATALKGHGATVRYVTLPLESHGYSGRESVLHTVAEMLNWMNKYVRDARPKETTASVGVNVRLRRFGSVRLDGVGGQRGLARPHWHSLRQRGTPRFGALLCHIHVVQRAFLNVWTTQPMTSAFKEPSTLRRSPR